MDRYTSNAMVPLHHGKPMNEGGFQDHARWQKAVITIVILGVNSARLFRTTWRGSH